jgi:GNAT superfamily N-acetyltransferase
MNTRLRATTDPERIEALIPLIEGVATETLSDWRDGPLPEGTGRSFFRRHGAHGATLVLLAEDEDDPDRTVGLCLTGPHEDPLTGEVTPLVLVLWVDPDVRHRGVARALVRQVRKLLAERGFPELAARAGHNDDALISMGERWGFTRAWEFMVR